MTAIIEQIEQACKSKDHVSVKQSLDDIGTEELKRDAFERIIHYYEYEESQFPVGYVTLFIKWLLENKDFNTASGYIERLKKLGIPEEKISEIIYEYVIKPDEAFYEDRYDRHMELLNNSGVLFSKHTFDFHHIKKKITQITNRPEYNEKLDEMLKIKDASILIVDLIEMSKIHQMLAENNILYLVYDDLNKFYYMLLFEDLFSIRENDENTLSEVRERVIYFVGRDMDGMRRFFLENMMTFIPKYVAVKHNRQEYYDFLDEITNQRMKLIYSKREELNAFCKTRDHKYYQELLSGETSDIRVLVITSLHTTLHQHISRGWYESFLTLGYTARLLIEKMPYEQMNANYIAEAICEFRPDMVFYINFPVNTIFEEDDIKNSLLWIMRHRDYININFGGFKYENENSFYLPYWWEFADALRKSSVPENRICYTVEGVDTNTFKKSGVINDKYAADIVSVNNAVGNELFKLEFYLNMVENEPVKKTMHKLYHQMQEMSLNDRFLSIEEFFELFKELYGPGTETTNQGEQFLSWFYFTIADTFYRRRVIDWIIDSNITKNIKVWGTGWSNIDKFKNYHMGIAQHGRQLCEIYESSKISLCDSWAWNTHERNIEVMASGGFPLIRYINVEGGKNMDVITNYFKEDEEVVLFYEKDDLLNKIQYYLDNPEKRKRIAVNGNNAAIRKFSMAAITEKTMEFIKGYYK